jgi:TIR domain-containing protein
MARYEVDAFISFSHLDDLSASAAPGWVRQFHSNLTVSLTKRLGRKAVVWLDEDQLNGQVLFDQRIQKEIERSAVLIALHSAAYMNSPYCTKEREWFAKTGLELGDQRRILLVRLVDIPPKDWPKEFAGCLGFKFFEPSPTDPLGSTLYPTDQGFPDALKSVVVAIHSILELAAPETKPALPPAADPIPAAGPPPVNGGSAPCIYTPVNGPAEPANGVAAPVNGASAPPNGTLADTLEFEVLKRSFKDDFQKCVTQIKLLSARKDLHDQLHELQFKFLSVSDLLPANALTIDGQLVDIVREHNFMLSEILDRLRAIAGRNVVPANEIRWIDDVVRAQGMIEVGLRDLDLVPLRTAVKDIGRVISVWLSRINTKLNETARELALFDLATKLQQLCTKCVAFRQQLGDKIQQLQDLHAQISRLVADHDDWQTYDDELSLLEGAVKRSLEEIAATWPGLKQKASTLYGEKSAVWVERLKFWGDKMDNALRTADIATAQESFIRLRSAARERFYLADKDLKSGCQALAQVGEPIELVLRAR